MPIGADKLSELPQTVNEMVADRAIRHALYLERYKTQLVEQVMAQFNREMQPELLAKIESSLQRVAGTSKQLQTLFKHNGELIREHYKAMEAKLYEQLRDFTNVESSWLIKTLEQVSPIAWDFVAPSSAILKSLITQQPMEGALVKEWFGKLSKDTAFAINRQIQMGMIEGEGIEKIVRRIKGTRAAQYSDGILNASRHSLRAVVRTSVSNVAHLAREETYKANDDVVKGVQIQATLDTRTCPRCMNWDGETYEIGEGPRPPAHYSCLPGDSFVLSRQRVMAVSKRWFDGEIIILQSASRRKLSCTPNHPILTDGGWVPANLLNVGTYIVCDGGREWKPLANMDGKDVPTRIEDISKSFLNSVEMQTSPVPVSPEDFHGDGVGSKVAIIASNRFLRNGWDASRNQHCGHSDFVVANKLPGLIPFQTDCDFVSMLLRMRATYGRLMRSLCQICNDRWRSLIHSRLLLVTPISQSNTSFFENPENWLPRASELVCNPLSTDSLAVKIYDLIFGQQGHSGLGWTKRDIGLAQNPRNDFIGHVMRLCDSLYRFACKIRLADFIIRQISLVAPDADAIPFKGGRNSLHGDLVSAADILGGKTGPVFFDDIVDVRRTKFSGHVYNLETQNGFYSAQGIITHNCRCTSVPVLKSWKELGIDAKEAPASTRASMNGQVADTTTYPEWLKKQTAEVQDDALGVSRGRMFRSGQLKLNDFIDRLNKPLTLKELERMVG